MAGFQSQLQALTMEQIQSAFDKAKDDIKFPVGRLVLITDKYYEKALEFIRTNFLVQEPIGKALGVPWNDEVKEFWMSFYRYNISIMLLSDDDEVIAIRTSKFVSSDEKSDDNAIKTPSQKLLMQFDHKGEAKSNYFGHFGAKECVQFYGLGTSDKYRHHHLATLMFNAAVTMAKNFGVDQLYIKGEGSNIYSKLIYERAGFEQLHEEMFDDFEVDGVKPIRNTGENTSLTYYGLKISST